MIKSPLLLLALVAGVGTAAERQQAVPSRFLGEWNSNPKDCGTGLNDSRLRISKDRVRFYESGGPIRAVVTEGEFGLALITELSGEGKRWLTYHHFRLSADHSYMTDVTNDSKFVRYRCPRTYR